MFAGPGWHSRSSVMYTERVVIRPSVKGCTSCVRAGPKHLVGKPGSTFGFYMAFHPSGRRRHSRPRGGWSNYHARLSSSDPPQSRFFQRYLGASIHVDTPLFLQAYRVGTWCSRRLRGASPRFRPSQKPRKPPHRFPARTVYCSTSSWDLCVSIRLGTHSGRMLVVLRHVTTVRARMSSFMGGCLIPLLSTNMVVFWRHSSS